MKNTYKVFFCLQAARLIKKMYYITYTDCTLLVSVGVLVRALRNKRPSRCSFRLTAFETLRAWELAGAYNLGPATSILSL